MSFAESRTAVRLRYSFWVILELLPKQIFCYSESDVCVGVLIIENAVAVSELYVELNPIPFRVSFRLV